MQTLCQPQWEGDPGSGQLKRNFNFYRLKMGNKGRSFFLDKET